MGRLTKDPEVRYTSSQKPVANFNLAVDRRFSKEDQADFIPCVAWNKTAEFMEKYIHKGQRVLVTGSLQSRSWETSDGQKRSALEVNVIDVEFADSKQSAPGRQEAAPAGFAALDDDCPF